MDETSSRENNLKTNRVNSNYNSATIVKKKNKHRVDDPSQLSTIDSIDISRSEQTTTSEAFLDLNNDNNNQLDDQQYEDITDVQVIAKMQEEALRQSVLNLTKSKRN